MDELIYSVGHEVCLVFVELEGERLGNALGCGGDHYSVGLKVGVFLLACGFFILTGAFGIFFSSGAED